MKRRYTDEELLTALRGDPNLSARDWIRRRIKPSPSTIMKRFGSWNKAREKAGLPILRRRRGRKWTKEEIIESLKKLAEELGRSPVIRDDPALYQASRTCFGSWNKAKKVAGLKTFPRNVNMRRMLKLLEDGNILSPGDIEERGISNPCATYRSLLREGNEIYRINLTARVTFGSAKYRKSRLLKSDTPQVVYYTDIHALGDYLKNIFRFELTQDLDPGLKSAVTNYLKKRVSEETMKELKSLYVKER